jgi:hypothetical protein
METSKLKYVEIAASKDIYRASMTGVYRDTDCLVATDGHRLHFSNGLEKVKKGFYLDGRTGDTFPDWQSAISTDSTYEHFNLKFSKSEMRELKALLKLLSLNDYTNSVWLIFDTEEGVRVSTETGKEPWKANNSPKLRVSIRLLDQPIPKQNGRLYLNLKYLLDAIELPFKEFPGLEITVKVPSRGASAYLFETALGTAAIMPIKGFDAEEEENGN